MPVYFVYYVSNDSNIIIEAAKPSLNVGGSCVCVDVTLPYNDPEEKWSLRIDSVIIFDIDMVIFLPNIDIVLCIYPNIVHEENVNHS